MRTRDGQRQVSTWLPLPIADAFEQEARQTDGGVSGAIRKLIVETVTGKQAQGPRGVGRGSQIGVRLRDKEREALAEAADQRATSPANWLRSLAIVHLARRPQWNTAELDTLRELSRQLGAIGNNINQIAYAINLAVHNGDYPPGQGIAARQAAEVIRLELRRVAAAVTGNFDYWGLPMEDQPTGLAGAAKYEDALARIAEAERRSRPRRRPRRFVESS